MVLQMRVSCQQPDCDWSGALSTAIQIGTIEISKAGEESRMNDKPLCPQCLVGTLKNSGTINIDDAEIK